MRVSWLAVVLLADVARAEPAAATPPLAAALHCEPAQSPGRIRCELELRPAPGLRLSWADALVVTAPSFARPLRARVPANLSSDGSARAALALLATTPGAGVLRVQGRAVLCPRAKADAPVCVPARAAAEFSIRVGKEGP